MTERTEHDRLREYLALVRSWAPKLDLVGPREIERFERRHIQDSLRVVPLLDEAPPGPCADVGSGAGLPGIPLAIARPGRRWRLLEPRRKRAAFLEEAVRDLGLDCEVVAKDAERAASDPSLAGAHAFVTARALAPPAAAFELILPLVASDGIGAVFVGEGAAIPPIAEEWKAGVAIVRHRGAAT